MRLLIGERTAAVEVALDMLHCIPLAESGLPVVVKASAVTDEALALSRFTIITGYMTRASTALLHRHPRGGVLYIGATTGLHAKGTLRELFLDRTLANYACFGTRQWSLEEHDFARVRRVQVYSMVEITREGLAEITDAAMMYARQWECFHLVLHIDALDPVFAPAGQQGAGFTSRELLYVLQRLLLIQTLESVEIITGTGDERCADAAAKLLAECLASKP